ncbi:MAG: T9SS type A sorting domain-containing protein [Melioribacteraceae bacterium]
MKNIIIILFFLLSRICIAQIHIEYLNDVPAEFKEKYYRQKRNYNPLQVGNVWQYYYSDYTYPFYRTTMVVKDSVINGKKYFKKIYYQDFPNYTPTTSFVTWERNDTVSGVTFMLDLEDINKNGVYLEELPLDSLENPYWSRYKTYKYSFNTERFWSGEKTVHVKDTNWVILEGDTVISRRFEILELFWWEEIIESFGIFAHSSELPARYCTGAIINGRKYGTIVSVEDDKNQSLPSEFYLSNNYPNPFNPSTTINYTIPENRNGNSYSHVKLVVYDPLGREVTVLVNESKPAGNYSVVFNAQNLPSGVYYYSLISGTTIITKSMVLIK